MNPSKLRGALARRTVTAAALASAVLFAIPASAGTLHTTDDAGIFTSSQLATVRSQAQGDNFDVRLITSSSHASKSDLGSYVHRFVTEPNLVVIGLDPVRRHISVHFGAGTRIADSEFKSIESAGVPSFKDSDWTGGVVAILDRAERAVGTGGGRRAAAATAPAAAAAPAGAEASSSGSGGLGVLFWIVAIAGAIGVVAWLVGRRRAYGPSVGGYSAPAGGYVPPVGGFSPPVGGYGVSPFGPSPYGGGGSGLGAKLASAGLGGLLGYEIGKEVAESHHPGYQVEDLAPRYQGSAGGDERPRGWDAGGDSAEPGNYDAGGASGDWDSSDSSGDGASGDADAGGGGDADF